MLADEGLEQEKRELAAARQLALNACLHKLSQPNRELLMAPYIADSAVVKIADKSGRSVNSLYKLLGRLRIKLRGCVQESLTLRKTSGVTT
jgi:DNA-directed RNA polymerase specialized sigma24 family protein